MIIYYTFFFLFFLAIIAFFSKNPIYSIIAIIIISILLSLILSIFNFHFFSISVLIIYTGGLLILLIFGLLTFDSNLINLKYNFKKISLFLYFLLIILIVLFINYTITKESTITYNINLIKNTIETSYIFKNLLINYEFLFYLGSLFYVDHFSIYLYMVYFLFLELFMLVIVLKDNQFFLTNKENVT